MKGIDYFLALVIAIISYFNSHNFALSNDLSTSTPPYPKKTLR